MWDTKSPTGRTYFEVAKAMRMRHHEFGEIREALLALGMCVSKNAIIGKIDRAIKRGSIPSNVRVHKKDRQDRAKEAARPVDHPIVDVMRYMDVKHPTLFNISEGQCSYLGCDIGMVGFLCCGAPTLPGRSFCEAHHRLTRSPTRPLNIDALIACYCGGVAARGKTKQYNWRRKTKKS